MMRSSIIAAMLLLATDGAMAVQNRSAGEPQTWTTSRAQGLEVEYPSSIFNVDLGGSKTGADRKLGSVDGAAGLMFHVESNERHDTPRSFLRARLATRKTQIDYTRVTDRFVVVSGVRGGRVYYSRCNFPDGPSGPIHCVDIIYRQSEKQFWDSVVTRISLSLR